jgi:hypothetical protein
MFICCLTRDCSGRKYLRMHKYQSIIELKSKAFLFEHNPDLICKTNQVLFFNIINMHSLTLAWFVSPSVESILYAGSMLRPSTEAWTREECLTTIKYLLDGGINVVDNVYPVFASVGLIGKQTEPKKE